MAEPLAIGAEATDSLELLDLAGGEVAVVAAGGMMAIGLDPERLEISLEQTDAVVDHAESEWRWRSLEHVGEVDELRIEGRL
jgi:hypothetical protein